MIHRIVSQVADGIEGVAVHPSGKFPVFSCLEDSPRLVHQAYSHLAVIDLTAKLHFAALLCPAHLGLMRSNSQRIRNSYIDDYLYRRYSM